jgi:hypothetical protein
VFVAAAAIGAVVMVGAQQSGAPPDVSVTGDLRQWHKVTLTFTGPQADEAGTAPNPFLDYRLSVTFAHESGSPAYTIPGYFAADGNAANSSATSGNKWRVHLTPDKIGRWNYRSPSSAEKAWRWQVRPQVRRSRPCTGVRAPFRLAAPTSGRRTCALAADCSMRGGTICNLPAAASIF